MGRHSAWNEPEDLPVSIFTSTSFRVKSRDEISLTAEDRFISVCISLFRRFIVNQNKTMTMIKRLPTLLALCLGVHSYAQDTTKSKQLDEVIVTANKLAQKQSTTGKVITVI